MRNNGIDNRTRHGLLSSMDSISRARSNLTQRGTNLFKNQPDHVNDNVRVTRSKSKSQKIENAAGLGLNDDENDENQRNKKKGKENVCWSVFSGETTKCCKCCSERESDHEEIMALLKEVLANQEIIIASQMEIQADMTSFKGNANDNNNDNQLM